MRIAIVLSAGHRTKQDQRSHKTLTCKKDDPRRRSVFHTPLTMSQTMVDRATPVEAPATSALSPEVIDLETWYPENCWRPLRAPADLSSVTAVAGSSTAGSSSTAQDVITIDDDDSDGDIEVISGPAPLTSTNQTRMRTRQIGMEPPPFQTSNFL